ncbi:hypothetical protein AMS68_001527 [Peltaster fructicola]|uniref:Uncharacterized protein n=1 Tax=Peltaster fructicola TaxID=286661 RepID=A0A6H0XNE6_9PEZI|nr:hypothetical protein AMS68_001527 [Peltaster fructicola]
MAGFLPEHLPLESPITPTHATRRAAGAPVQTPANLNSISSQDSKRLIKRKSMLSLALPQISPLKLFQRSPTSPWVYTTARASHSVDGLDERFRCDVLAVSADDFRAAEAECKQLIIEAGGTILEHLRYPGGFLFELSCLIECPLVTGDKTAGGGTIVVDIVESVGRSHLTSQSPSHTHVRPQAVKPRSNWTVKAVNRLQKKHSPIAAAAAAAAAAEDSGDPFSTRTNSHPRYLGFDNRRLTIVEMLLEEARLREGDGAARRNEDDWETISEEDDE